MGGFCVFGQSMEVARTRAAKKVSEFDPGTRRPLTEAEWRALVETEAAAVFSRMKPVRVSPEFDAPQFARDFIHLAARSAPPLLMPWRIWLSCGSIKSAMPRGIWCSARQVACRSWPG